MQLNVGPLVAPITRQQYNARSVPTPPKLFSHNDQQSVWQSSAPEGSPTGWGGRIGDLVLSNNANSTSLFTCISVTGNAVFLAGNSALSYQVGTGGPVRIRALNDTSVYNSQMVRAAITALAVQERTHRLEKEYNLVTGRANGAFSASWRASSPHAATWAPNARCFLSPWVALICTTTSSMARPP